MNDIDNTLETLKTSLKQIKQSINIQKATIKEETKDLPEDQKIIIDNLQKELEAIMNSNVPDKLERIAAIGKKYKKWA